MPRVFVSLLLILVGLPCAAGADSLADVSLHAFFAHGVVIRGARAELLSVEQWPAGMDNVHGKIRWILPAFRRHPERIYLIAETGNGKRLRRWHVPVRLRWWANAVVMRTDAPARTLLTRSMLMNRRVNIAGHAGHWWTDAGPLTGSRLTRPLRAGQPIYRSYVRRPKLLRRGDRVTMIADIGGLKVRAAGKVMQSAGAGERILVRNISSRKVLQAIVLDAATVRVIRGGMG